MRSMLVLVLAACGAEAPPVKPVKPVAAPVDAAVPAPKGPPRLVTEDEIKVYEAALTKRLAANQSRTCARPVLRGAPVAGPAATDMLAIEQPIGALATCLTKLGELAAADDGLAKSVADRKPTLVAFDKACGAELETVILTSVAHEDACSPFQVGVRVEPRSFLPYLHIAHLVGLRARLLGDRDPKAGVLLALDLARFGQDLGRNAGFLNLAVGGAMTELAVESARTILERRKLAIADLDALVPAVHALLASDPPFSASLAAELDYFALYYALTPLQPAEWVAPGGWPDGQRPASNSKNLAFSKHARDEAAIFFAVVELVASKVAQTCTATTSIKDCNSALEALALTPRPGDPAKLYADLERTIADAPDAKIVDEVRLRIRSAVVDILADGLFGSYPAGIARHGESVARIAALHVHLETLKTIAKTRRCPTQPAIASPVVQPLGDKLKITVDGKRAIVVGPPRWTTHKIAAYTIRCP
jgi:hypothetical protein